MLCVDSGNAKKRDGPIIERFTFLLVVLYSNLFFHSFID